MKEYRLSHVKQDLILGILEAIDIEVTEASLSLKNYINSQMQALLERENGNSTAEQEAIKKAIRNLLRNGKYSPTGRGKPASEYLWGAISTQKEFPYINNVVDIGNFVSFHSGFPISVFDMDKCVYPLTVRLGEKEESYVFNSAGHSINLQDLLLVADAVKAIGNPVKDSMETKVFVGAKNLVAFVYAETSVCSCEKMQDILKNFEVLLKEHASAKAVEYRVMSNLRNGD